MAKRGLTVQLGLAFEEYFHRQHTWRAYDMPWDEFADRRTIYDAVDSSPKYLRIETFGGPSGIYFILKWADGLETIHRSNDWWKLIPWYNL